MKIGLIGYQGIGKMHSHGFKNVQTFFDLDVTPEMQVICGRNEKAVKKAAEQYGWNEWSTDWRDVVRRPDIDLIDICTPPYLHAEITIEAAKAGKHIICEKPLANSLHEALDMISAVKEHGVKHMTAFSFRCVPAIKLAYDFIRSGELGEIYHWRGQWLSDFIDPSIPASWHFQKDKAGSGALGDIGSHLIDLSHYLVGNIDEVCAVSSTFISERIQENMPDKKVHVDIDDAVQFIARFENGATGIFEATRCAGGCRDEFIIEINGSKGTLCFNSNRYNELCLYYAKENIKTRGKRTIFVGNQEHPYGESICPYGEVIGRSDVFILQAFEFFNAIQNDMKPQPGFYEGAQCQAVVDAVINSASSKQWINPDYESINSL
ncbi:MAG: Gfo/Idh/MocA family oxidoreductase [Bacteroidetes bacterium]|nr:Gfo/Idh/MocA family oxidoreductase [Bacteroidota bacterium]